MEGMPVLLNTPKPNKHHELRQTAHSNSHSVSPANSQTLKKILRPATLAALANALSQPEDIPPGCSFVLFARIVSVDSQPNKYLLDCSDDSLAGGLRVQAAKQSGNLGQFLGLAGREESLSSLEF